MKKAVLGNRIYLNRTKELHDLLISELTHPVNSGKPNTPTEYICDVTRINKDILTIPVGRSDLIPSDYEIVDKRNTKPVIFPKFKFKLRDTQQEVFDACSDNCVICANPSWGKTFMGVSLSAKLGQKTLIITHTKYLRDQWIGEIKACLGIDAGVIGGGKFSIDEIIVVATVQTLRNKIATITKEFGTIIVDECLDYETKIDTLEYGRQKIGKIVNNEMPVHVKSWDGSKFEYKKVLRYFKNAHKEEMIKYTLDNNSVLKCTLNHTLYKYENNNIVKDTADNIVEGDYLVSEPSHKSSNLLLKDLGIVLGCIIGDGSLQSNNDNTKSIRIKITNGEKQKDYLQYKKTILKNICRAKTIEGKSGYKPENKIFSFSTLSFIDINNWYTKLYNNEKYKNTISKDLANLLTKEAWSIIYQDDGSISQGTIQIHVYMDDIGLSNLIDSLNNLFNIRAYTFSYTKNNKILTGIKLNTKDTKTFIQQIEQFIHPDLKYKVGNYSTDKQFVPIKPITGFENYTLTKIVNIDFELPTGNNRYNIEVEDNHNYIANGKLVANCHHVPADVFKTIVDAFNARYKIGLTATPWRKDGKHVLLNDYFSPIQFSPKDENRLNPNIIMIKTEIPFSSNGMIPWGTRLNELYARDDYMELIINLAHIQALKGHLVLVVADRVEFLRTCAEVLEDEAMLVIGDSIDRDFLNSGKRILFGSTKIYTEGVNIPPLSSLILAVPVNNDGLLDQVIGRVCRVHPGKKTPEVIDIILSGKTAKSQAKQRLGYYMNKDYKVSYI